MSVFPVQECLRLSRAVKVCPSYWLRVLTRSQTITSHYVKLEQFQISFQKPDPRGNLILGKNLKINPAEGLGFFCFFNPKPNLEIRVKAQIISKCVCSLKRPKSPIRCSRRHVSFPCHSRAVWCYFTGWERR